MAITGLTIRPSSWGDGDKVKHSFSLIIRTAFSFRTRSYLLNKHIFHTVDQRWGQRRASKDKNCVWVQRTDWSMEHLTHITLTKRHWQHKHCLQVAVFFTHILWLPTGYKVKPKPYLRSSHPLFLVNTLVRQVDTTSCKPSIELPDHISSSLPFQIKRSSPLVFPAHTDNPTSITALHVPAVFSLLKVPQVGLSFLQTKPLESKDYEVSFVCYTVPTTGLGTE